MLVKLVCGSWGLKLCIQLVYKVASQCCHAKQAWQTIKSIKSFLGNAFISLMLCLFAKNLQAHHAFVTEFDDTTDGRVEGIITKVWWTNPHIRYDVEITTSEGTKEQWSLHPPGNLPTYRRENWTADTLKAGDHVIATGNLGRFNTPKLYATCIMLDSGRNLGRCVSPASVSKVTADPNVNHTYKAKDYEVDITGFWDNRYKFQTTVDDLQPKPMPMKESTAALYASRTYGDDLVLRCQPAGLPRIFGSPYPMEIVDAGSHYLLVMLQDNTPRRIYMDGRATPTDLPDSSMGFSRGHWEGNTLVIETTSLLPLWIDGSGYPLTGGPETRIVERWEVAQDGLTISREMTIYDSAYTAPLIRRRGSQRGDAAELIESPPCDPTTFLYEMWERGELEKRLLGIPLNTP
jgi:hypothetical protein